MSSCISLRGFALPACRQGSSGVVAVRVVIWVTLCGGLGCGGAAAQGIETRAAALTALPASNWSVIVQHRQLPSLPLLGEEIPPWHVGDALAMQADDTTRVAIEFRPRSATADLRDFGALRMQISSQGTLSLKPRRGGVQLAWRATF